MTTAPLNKEYLEFDFDPELDIDDDTISIAPDDASCYTAVARPMHIKSITGATSVAISRTSLSFRSNTSSNTSSIPHTSPVLLPWEISHEAYRPSEFVTVPVPSSELQLEARSTESPQRRRSAISKLLTAVVGQKEFDKYKMVRMRRDEYVKYWARDQKGAYIGSEPEGRGLERLKQGLLDRREMSLLESRGW